jgi:hypothetical protein
MLCDADVLSELSSSATVPVKVPDAGAVKLMGNWHDWPAAIDHPAAAPVLTSGQRFCPLLDSVKFPVTPGLLPLEGIAKLSGDVPMFSRVTVFGLSLLVDPGAVIANVMLGASA